MNTNTATVKTPLTGKQIAAAVISWMFVAITAYFSASHIFGLGRTNGLAMSEAIALVPMIDGFGVLGRILRSLTRPGSRRFGTWLTVIACTVSLAANFLHGHTLGQKLFGLITVAGFIAAEAATHAVAKDAAERNQPQAAAPQITAADVQAAVAAALAQARAEFAVELAATVAATADETRAAVLAEIAVERKRELRRERAAAKRVELAAQLSPATVTEIESSYPAPASSYEPAYL